MNDTHESIEKTDDGRAELQNRCERLEKENAELRYRLEITGNRELEDIDLVSLNAGSHDALRVIGFARELLRCRDIQKPEVPSMTRAYVETMPKGDVSTIGVRKKVIPGVYYRDFQGRDDALGS